MTSNQQYVPAARMQTPGEAKAGDRRSYGWGQHLLPQRTALAILAVQAGHHAVVDIAQFVAEADPFLRGSPATFRKLCKSIALTGLLVPYIEALPQNKTRFMFFLASALPDRESDDWRHLLTVDESNDRVEDPLAHTNRWIA